MLISAATRVHICEGFALLETCCYVKEYQFVGSCIAIGFAQFYRVASAAEVHEIGALHSLAVFYVEARDDSLCQTFIYSLFYHILLLAFSRRIL